MADQSVTVGIKAQDQTAAGVNKAKQNLQSLDAQAAAVRLQSQRSQMADFSKGIEAQMKLEKQKQKALNDQLKKAKEEQAKFVEGVKKGIRAVAEMAGAAVAVGMLIERVFNSANEAAERLGRVDVTSQYTEMQAGIQQAGDAILAATGLLDGFKAAWYGIEYAARLTAAATIVGMGEVQKILLDVGKSLGTLALQFAPIAAGMKAFSPGVGVILDAAAATAKMTDAEIAAAKAAIDLNTRQNILLVTDENLKKRVVELSAAEKKKTEEAKKAAEAEKQRALNVYKSILDITRDYMRRKKEIETGEQDDINDAIRAGDARALINAQKDREKAYKDLEQSRKDAMENLALQTRPIKTAADVSKLAGELGLGSEYAANVKTFGSDYGSLAQFSPGAIRGGPQEREQVVNVQVYIGDEEVDGVVRSSLTRTLFNKPGDKTSTASTKGSERTSGAKGKTKTGGSTGGKIKKRK